MRESNQAPHAVITIEGTEYRLEPGRSLSVGRHRENTVVIDSASISRFHASIRWLADRSAPEIVDHGSQNGTAMGGLEIGRRPVPLRDGVLILLGSRVAQVRLRNADNAALLEDAPEVVALFSEQGSEVGGSLDTAVDLPRVLRILEAEERTGTLHVVLAGDEQGGITFCQGRIMAVHMGIARRTRALEHLLSFEGRRLYSFSPDLEPTDTPMNLWFTDYLRKWNRGYTPKRPHRCQRGSGWRNAG